MYNKNIYYFFFIVIVNVVFYLTAVTAYPRQKGELHIPVLTIRPEFTSDVSSSTTR